MQILLPVNFTSNKTENNAKYYYCKGLYRLLSELLVVIHRKDLDPTTRGKHCSSDLTRTLRRPAQWLRSSLAHSYWLCSTLQSCRLNRHRSLSSTVSDVTENIFFVCITNTHSSYLLVIHIHITNVNIRDNSRICILFYLTYHSRARSTLSVPMDFSCGSWWVCLTWNRPAGRGQALPCGHQSLHRHAPLPVHRTVWPPCLPQWLPGMMK